MAKSFFAPNLLLLAILLTAENKVNPERNFGMRSNYAYKTFHSHIRFTGQTLADMTTIPEGQNLEIIVCFILFVRTATHNHRRRQ